MSIENTFTEIEYLKYSLNFGTDSDMFKSFLYTLSNKELLKVTLPYYFFNCLKISN